MKTSINSVLNSTNSIAEVCMGYSGDILNPNRQKFNLQYYLDLAKRIEDTGAHILCIKDMAGLLKPYAAEKLITELKKSIAIPIHLHTHDTAGIQSATYLKAVEAGVDIIDVALSSMSGLTSQPNFNVFVEALKGTPRHSDFDVNILNQYSNYWEDVREYYYPFESDLKSSTAEVYKHEIPGGQYSNLKPQAYSLGLENRMSDIKQAYEDANDLLGDIIKVTPSSKVVGDLAMFMVNSNLTKQDVLDKGHTLSFPNSVKGMLMGELGQPDGGWPEEFQKMVLKGEKPFVDLPNKHLVPVDFDKEFDEFKIKFSSNATLADFLSYKFYPKVYEDYFNATKEWGNVSAIPTPVFFYGLKPNEEIIINISKGKNIIVKFLYKTEPDEKGIINVYFKLNGQTRSVEIKDISIKLEENQNKKAISAKEVGSPLPGLLSKIWVKEGDSVKENQPLFTIEAMKMENTVLAISSGVINAVFLKENTLVDINDLIVEYK
jgi:pyruvate carboxylase